MTREQRRRFFDGLTDGDAAMLVGDWRFWARRDQLAPDGDWTTWVFVGGRGSGKTWAGAHFVAHEVWTGRAANVALVAETLADARDVMIEGVSGLRAATPPGLVPRFESSRRRLVFHNGAVAQIFSSEDPDSLRGPQFDCAWCDEFCKWRYPEETWDQLQFALRLGKRPRQMVTTTPRNMSVLRRIVEDRGTVVTHAPTRANRHNLSRAFLENIERRYAGTRLGRQELEGEILDDAPGALWTRDLIEKARIAGRPDCTRIVVAVDPPVSAGEDADECGIVVAGRMGENAYAVLADRSVQGLSPMAWAQRVVGAYHEFQADRVVAEVNQGGDLVAAVLAHANPAVPVKAVHATRGKFRRAEPVAALYEQGRVFHAGAFPALEDQMCLTVPGDASARSDRLDALVWGVTELVNASASAEPRMRIL